MAEQEHDFIQTATVGTGGRVRRGSIQAHLWNELIDENDHANSADESTQERSAKDRVEETKSAKSSCEDDSARKSGHHTCDSGVLLASLVGMVS